jgi:choline dehydrogenase-like flavoprotein
MTELKCDILIIGAGAAGGVLAATLAEKTSKSIVLLEKGAYYTKEFFNQRQLDMTVLFAENGARSTHDGAIPVRGGQCVGGGTTVNVALCFNPIRAVWDGWKTYQGLQGFSFDAAANDYGITGLNISSCLKHVRDRINVHTPGENEVNDNNRLFAQGCRNLNISVKHFELNMRGCIGCGFCIEGCAYDHKQGTMVTYINDALAHGVKLIHHCDTESLEIEKRGGKYTVAGALARVRPTSEGSQPNSVKPGSLRIMAKVVIVSSGSIESPMLLARSGHPDPHDILGRGLILHPSLPIIGLMDSPMVNYRGISGTYYSDHFYTSHGFYHECLFGHPNYVASVLPGIGLDHFALMDAYPKMRGFGVMLVDTVRRENRVEWDFRTKQYVIHYLISEEDKKRLRFAARKGVEIMFAGGAREVLLPSEQPIGPLATPHFHDSTEALYCEELQFLPHETTITSSHCQATVKMSEDPRQGMINSRCESHAVSNLLVCDSSSFPSSCGSNPMISIMTLARYQASRIAMELPRYEL